MPEGMAENSEPDILVQFDLEHLADSRAALTGLEGELILASDATEWTVVKIPLSGEPLQISATPDPFLWYRDSRYRKAMRLCPARDVQSLRASATTWGAVIGFSERHLAWIVEPSLEFSAPAADQTVKAVIACGNSMTDLSPLQHLTQLTQLYLSGCSLTDLSPLQHLTQLTQLDLSWCHSLTDLSPLQHLTQLAQLDLSWCHSLTDLSPLQHLTQLTQLDLSRVAEFEAEALTDLSPLQHLTQLTQLKLKGCASLTDLSPLQHLTQLTQLDLQACKSLTDLSPLQHLTQLTQLNLKWCSPTDLSPLQHLTQLTQLNLTRHIEIVEAEALTDLSPLQHLTQLTQLDLQACKSLTDLSPLQHLTQLTQLDLSGCASLTDLSPLQHLTQLTELDLKGCASLTDLSPLQHLTQLTQLKLKGRESLTDLSPLQHLTQLTQLDLSGCESLTDLSPLQHLTQLTQLKLSKCASLTDLSPLQHLTQLTQLDLYWCNSLTDLSPLQHLTQLTQLDLRGCPYLRDVLSLSALSNLRRLELEREDLRVRVLLRAACCRQNGGAISRLVPRALEQLSVTDGADDFLADVAAALLQLAPHAVDKLLHESLAAIARLHAGQCKLAAETWTSLLKVALPLAGDSCSAGLLITMLAESPPTSLCRGLYRALRAGLPGPAWLQQQACALADKRPVALHPRLAADAACYFAAIRDDKRVQNILKGAADHKASVIAALGQDAVDDGELTSGEEYLQKLAPGSRLHDQLRGRLVAEYAAYALQQAAEHLAAIDRAVLATEAAKAVLEKTPVATASPVLFCRVLTAVQQDREQLDRLLAQFADSDLPAADKRIVADLLAPREAIRESLASLLDSREWIDALRPADRRRTRAALLSDSTLVARVLRRGLLQELLRDGAIDASHLESLDHD